MIKARENKKATSDLLVCFPTRAHLSLMPKQICSPSRPNSAEANKRLRRITTRTASSLGAGSGPGNNNSPLIWAKDNQIRGGGPEMSEPTSPKVTCAGQIKVRPNTSCRNWQSVMEEIEKIHLSNSKKKKKSNMIQTFGFKKDIMNFLTCLRNVRFDFRCFGAIPNQVLSSDDEDEDEDEDDGDDDFVYEEEDTFKEIIDEVDKYNTSNNNNNNNNDNDNNNDSNAVFSKWFMVLQENQNIDVSGKNTVGQEIRHDNDATAGAPAVPPPNALLLMRCRSAPAAKRRLEENADEKVQNNNNDDNEEDNKENNVDETITSKKKRETLAIVMKYDSDFYKMSNDVAQETWVVGEFKGPFSRSRSSRR